MPGCRSTGEQILKAVLPKRLSHRNRKGGPKMAAKKKTIYQYGVTIRADGNVISVSAPGLAVRDGCLVFEDELGVSRSIASGIWAQVVRVGSSSGDDEGKGH